MAGVALGMFQVVGGQAVDAAAFAQHDACFGRYASSAAECKLCVAPIIHGGRLFLFRELCRARAEGVVAGQLVRLSAGEVLHRLEVGRSVFVLWQEILGDCDPQAYGRDARVLLSQRFRHLHVTLKLSVPELPPLAQLLEEMRA